MAYLRKVKIKGKEYWYLFQTVREGDKFKKKSKYLGKKLPEKKELERIKREFLEELITTKSKYLSGEDVKRIEAVRETFKEEYSEFSKTEKEKYIRGFLIKFTYDTNAIEGSTLSYKDTAHVLEGIAPKGKTINEVLEAKNMEVCFNMILNHKGDITVNFILKLHRTLVSGIDEEIAGTIRKTNVAIYGSKFEPPAWGALEYEMGEFIKWHKKSKKELHPFELAVLVHLKLVTIHPFVDGNGRISRLLMNFVLNKKGYPMLNIRYRDREKYYGALEECQVKEVEEPFIRYATREYFGAYEKPAISHSKTDTYSG
ncbi:MAG: hypothetical protein MSIBF_02865 [Candidatus Altiarchaeales archaeon IMC4]|nr:MAG: hypothetical protein MSIBF_02865 [Candidatus Altiarchaeales archaeon IMC4]